MGADKIAEAVLSECDDNIRRNGWFDRHDKAFETELAVYMDQALDLDRWDDKDVQPPTPTQALLHEIVDYFAKKNPKPPG